MGWLTYWNKKNIWTDSDIWKKNTEIFYKKTFDIFNYNKKHTVLDIGCGNGDFAKKVSNKDEQLIEQTRKLTNDLREKMNNQNLNEYIKSVINISFLTNKYINDAEPWKIKKTNTSSKKI